MAGELACVASAVQERYTLRLEKAGVRFALDAVRRLTVRGIADELRLHVWPQTGFDNFQETWRVRRWFGTPEEVRSLASLEEWASSLLERFERGEEPPFAAEHQ